MISLRRIIQALCLLLFLLLLGLATVAPDWLATDAFLRLDPLVLLGTVISVRDWVPGLGLAVLVLGLTLILGRFFCGYICPMGTTLDISDWLLSGRTAARKSTSRGSSQELSQALSRAPSPGPSWLPGARIWKYLLLCFILGAGGLGVSAVFLASPLSLITRFYALLIHPLLSLAADQLLSLTSPLTSSAQWDVISYLHVSLPRYALQWFVLVFFLAVFTLGAIAPRFWCRYLCPSGAILALFGSRPLLRRRVSEKCTQCGQCQRSCPMRAIADDPRQTAHDECISCQTCVQVCPVDAVTFAPMVSMRSAGPRFLPQRRAALLAGLAGAGAATLTYTGLAEVRSQPLPGNLTPGNLLRPPGSLPERQFLARCIRCGLCMRACPTNTLQPLGLQAGTVALFSPRLTPRRGPCAPECALCGQVCPTGAIRALPLVEKQWAKIGTATILRHACLAWEWNKKCLVCDEVCPYDAITLQRIPGHPIAVPFVDGGKCSGCGYCQYHCPVQSASAIVVEPMEAARLESGSYREAGRAAGLDLKAGGREPAPHPGMQFPGDSDGLEPDQPPPGFTR